MVEKKNSKSNNNNDNKNNNYCNYYKIINNRLVKHKPNLQSNLFFFIIIISSKQLVSNRTNRRKKTIVITIKKKNWTTKMSVAKTLKNFVLIFLRRKNIYTSNKMFQYKNQTRFIYFCTFGHVIFTMSFFLLGMFYRDYYVIYF